MATDAADLVARERQRLALLLVSSRANSALRASRGVRNLQQRLAAALDGVADQAGKAFLAAATAASSCALSARAQRVEQLAGGGIDHIQCGRARVSGSR